MAERQSYRVHAVNTNEVKFVSVLPDPQANPQHQIKLFHLCDVVPAFEIQMSASTICSSNAQK